MAKVQRKFIKNLLKLEKGLQENSPKKLMLKNQISSKKIVKILEKSLQENFYKKSTKKPKEVYRKFVKILEVKLQENFLKKISAHPSSYRAAPGMRRHVNL